MICKVSRDNFGEETEPTVFDIEAGRLCSMKEMPGNPACEDCKNMIKFVVVICQQKNLRGFQSKKDSYQRKCMMIFPKRQLKVSITRMILSPRSLGLWDPFQIVSLWLINGSYYPTESMESMGPV